jgi:hypothetical protein
MIRSVSSHDLQAAFLDHSIKTSGYDDHRDYIGLSTIAECPAEIYRRFFDSTPASVRRRLKTKASYEIEEDLKARLKAIGIYSPGKEISLFDGMVKGHTDGELFGALLEIKTVPLDDHIPQGKIPIRVYWQCQAYLKYGEYSLCHVLYYSREDGLFRFFEVDPHAPTMNLIEGKLERLVRAVRTRTRPACECGKCQDPEGALQADGHR